MLPSTSAATASARMRRRLATAPGFCGGSRLGDPP